MTTSRRGARYGRVERAIRALIAEVGPDGALPPEVELADRLGVSRGTVRKAMDRFVAAGAIQRTPSRGTFVARQPIERGIVVRKIGETIHGDHFEVVRAHVRRRKARAEEADALRLGRGDTVQAVTRHAHLNGRPVCLNVSVFPGSIQLPADLTLPWATSLSTVGIHLALLEDSVAAELASPRVARVLEIDPGMPVLTITRVAYDDANRPIEYSRAWLHPDARYRNQHRL